MSEAFAWPHGMTGAQALLHHAPAVDEMVQRLVRTLSVDPDRVALVRWACADAQDLAPLPAPPGAAPLPDAVVSRAWSTLPDAERTILRFAEQFSVDVSALDEQLRSDLWGVLGEEPRQARGRLLTMTWVADLLPRVRTALDRLFAPSGPLEDSGAAEATEDATPLGAEFVRRVFNLHGLDPVLSEMVRLRVARAHNCRMCKSLRTRSALAAGATERDFAAVDTYEASELSAAQKAALALVDAVLWSPARIPQHVVDDVRQRFPPDQAVELVLDVMRDSWNKTTVAAQLDEAHVTDGVELYEYLDDGTLEFFPAARSAS